LLVSGRFSNKLEIEIIQILDSFFGEQIVGNFLDMDIDAAVGP
jgi:hypothetical protein